MAAHLRPAKSKSKCSITPVSEMVELDYGRHTNQDVRYVDVFEISLTLADEDRRKDKKLTCRIGNKLFFDLCTLLAQGDRTEAVRLLRKSQAIYMDIHDVFEISLTLAEAKEIIDNWDWNAFFNCVDPDL